jgi:predicted Zn-dependent protease
MLGSATYFNGRDAASQDATIQLLGDSVEVRIGSRRFTCDRENTDLVPPVGSGPWVLQLADGSSLQIADDRLGRAIAEQLGTIGFVDRLERSWKWALLTLLVAAAGAWAILTFGVPEAAERIALAVPPELDRQLGDESIAVLDRAVFEASELSIDDRSHVRSLFEDIRDDYPDAHYYRIEFRSSPAIGANAFAVPGGLVVMTDEMVELAETDAELVAVLAHEIGHLHERHGLRILLQNSISAIVIAGLTGDLANITALSATIPTLLMQAKYSRDFERGADAFAFDYMDRHGLDPGVLSELLRRVEKEAAMGESALEPWFSSHPMSEDRRPQEN